MESLESEQRGSEYSSLTFHGTAGAYFSIWIVNLLLTIVTLGIYSPWAKVRTLKFLNQSIEFKGSRFDFHANPISILIGRIIAVFVFGLYFWGGHINPYFGLVGTIIGFFCIPFVIIKSFRFKAKYTSFRSLRFGFKGTVQEGYKLWFKYWSPFLITSLITSIILIMNGEGEKELAKSLSPSMFLLGGVTLFNLIYALIIAPYFLSAIYNFILNNIYYGGAKVSFNSTAKEVKTEITRPYVKCFLLYLVAVFVFAFFAYYAVPAEKSAKFVGGLVAVFSYTFLIAISFLLPYLMTKYVWSRLAIQSSNTKFNLTYFEYFKTAFGNLFAVSLSLGLLFPWARMRMRKLVTEAKSCNIEDLNQFTGVSEESVSSVAEEIGDVFDVDFDFGI